MVEKRFREITLSSGTKILLGKNAENNDELMKMFEGKENTILHTESPGSPFGIIKSLNPTKEEIYDTGIFVSRYSQDWRNNKKDVVVHIFTGKNVSKPKSYKAGSWKVRKLKKIKIKKEDIIRIKRKNKNDTRTSPAW